MNTPVMVLRAEMIEWMKHRQLTDAASDALVMSCWQWSQPGHIVRSVVSMSRGLSKGGCLTTVGSDLVTNISPNFIFQTFTRQRRWRIVNFLIWVMDVFDRRLGQVLWSYPHQWQGATILQTCGPGIPHGNTGTKIRNHLRTALQPWVSKRSQG